MGRAELRGIIWPTWACAGSAGLPEGNGAWLSAAGALCSSGRPSACPACCLCGRPGPFPARPPGTSSGATSSRGRLPASLTPRELGLSPQRPSPFLPEPPRLTAPGDPPSRPGRLSPMPRLVLSPPTACLEAWRSGCFGAALSPRGPSAAVDKGAGWREGLAPRGSCSLDERPALPSACCVSGSCSLGVPAAWLPRGAGRPGTGAGGSGLSPQGLCRAVPAILPPAATFTPPVATSPVASSREATRRGWTARVGMPGAS